MHCIPLLVYMNFNMTTWFIRVYYIEPNLQGGNTVTQQFRNHASCKSHFRFRYVTIPNTDCKWVNCIPLKCKIYDDVFRSCGLCIGLRFDHNDCSAARIHFCVNTIQTNHSSLSAVEAPSTMHIWHQSKLKLRSVQVLHGPPTHTREQASK